MDGSGISSIKKGGLELELEDLPHSNKKQKMRDLESILVWKEGTSTTSNLEFQKTQILQPCPKKPTSNPQTDPCLLTLAQPSLTNFPNLPDLNANTQPAQSECGSTTGPIEGPNQSQEENGPLQKWKQMKQNGFLSSTHHNIPAPKPRKSRKKTEDEIMKQKRAFVQKEQVNRFAKITGHNGLLTGLNPGIISKVRNSKQVYSIINAIVKEASFESTNKEIANNNNNNNNNNINNNNEGNNINSISNDLGSNKEAVTSLSLKAASAASQWMELLQQDIKCRLSALRRSKKRVRNVINTELPYIISTEIPYNSNNDNNINNSNNNNNDSNGAHVQKWKYLFTKMDRSLHEEGRYLENWLNQIQEMQLKCEKGLKYVAGMESLLLGPINTELSKGKKMEAMEHEQVVKAAAASMYSTCNLVTKNENISCF